MGRRFTLRRPASPSWDASPPVVQDVQLVRQRDTGVDQVTDRAHNVGRFHVPFRDTIAANKQDARVMPPDFKHEFVQERKIAAIMGEEDPVFPDGELEVDRIVVPCSANVQGEADIVARPA